MWEAMLPKRAGDELAGELMARGYYRMIGERLTEKEMSDLTELVLDRCKWFPTVFECKEIMGEQSYSNPFYNKRRHQHLERNGYTSLAAPRKEIEGPA